MEQWNRSSTGYTDENSYSHFGTQFGIFLSVIVLVGIYSTEIKTYVHIKTYMWM
jgi:hypothetical protein